MNNTDHRIVSAVAEKTGFSIGTANKIITEFARLLQSVAGNNRVVKVPGFGYLTMNRECTTDKQYRTKSVNIPDAYKWYLSDKPLQEFQDIPPEPYRIRISSGISRGEFFDSLKTEASSREILERFSNVSDMPNKTLAEQILGITPKTLYSLRNSDKELSIKMKEHLLKLEDLYLKGIELFTSAGNFNQWLKSESFGLGNVQPITLLNAITGIDLVYEELIRIEFGATA